MEKETFTRKELYELVWQTPFTTLSQKYDISDNGLRKTCVRLNIPYPKKGHWQKVQFGKKNPRTPLPKDIQVDQQVTLSLRTAGERNQPVDDSIPLQRTQSEIESAIAEYLAVPQCLSEPNNLVKALSDCLLKQEPDTWRYVGIVGSTRGILDTKVNIKNVQRALIFWNVLINALRARGHDIVIKYSRTYAVIDESEFSLLMREKSTKEIYVNDNWERTRYQATGILSLQQDSYPRKEWKDGKTITLEEQISKIIAFMEIEAGNNKVKRLICQRQEDERKEQERIRAEYLKRKENELSIFMEMLGKASRWQQANNLGNYIVEVEKQAIANRSISEELDTWLQWARQKADWYDPFIELVDELLSDVDRGSLGKTHETPANKNLYPNNLLENDNSYFASRWKNTYTKKG
ncbi:MAG: hypothetical protein EOP48_01405 [Sphingobacteriales bacterium]|nr:MAG: hypothetical protein EOP48_01405 [Sphingobacteriales bacterium]